MTERAVSIREAVLFMCPKIILQNIKFYIDINKYL